MTPEELYRCIEAVLLLPLPQQAMCLRFAAEASAPVWREWCVQRGVEDHSKDLLDQFDRWLDGAVLDVELDRLAKRLLASLPQDLREECEPAGAYAGWALLGIANIALDQCGDVHGDIMHTDVCYCAAAYCRVQIEPMKVGWARLTPAELDFLNRWWRRCCEKYPELADVPKRAEPSAAPNSRPPSQLPSSQEIQSSDSLRTSSSGGCG